VENSLTLLSLTVYPISILTKLLPYNHQQTFNPQNRICISGREGCPVCVSSLSQSAHKENFALSREELLGLPVQEVEAIGLCVLVQPGTLINLGDACSFSDEDFHAYAPKIT
jgi:hypothetical protein